MFAHPVRSPSSQDARPIYNESRHSFDWSIPKFLSSSQLKFTSPTYQVGVQESGFSSSWKLVLNLPSENEETASDYISLFIEELRLTEYSMSYQFSILNKFNLRCNIMTSESICSFVNSRESKGFSKFMKKSDLAAAAHSLLVNDELKINCVIHFMKLPFVNCSSPRFRFNANSVIKARSDKLKTDTSDKESSTEIGRVLWQHVIDKKYTDIVVEVGDEEFPLHRNVLARSPVFESMFDLNMKEANEKRVCIPDCEPAVFKELARYIYTGTAENLDDIAGKLIHFADQYCLDGLVALCENVLIRRLSADNAAETLQLAALLRLTLLQEETMQLIKSCPTQVVQSEGWQKLPSELSKEVTLALAKMIQDSLIQL